MCLVFPISAFSLERPDTLIKDMYVIMYVYGLAFLYPAQLLLMKGKSEKLQLNKECT